MRILAAAGALFALCLLPLACGGSPAPSASPSADRVVGVVNGHDVRRSDVDVVRVERRLVGDTASAGTEAFKEAVDRELLRQEAVRLGARAGAVRIDKRLAGLTSQLGGAAALKSALAKAHMTRAQLRQAITDGVLRESVQTAKFPNLQVGPAAVHAYYKAHLKGLFTEPASVHLGTIPVRVRGIAENVLKQLRRGHTFASVARQFSLDPQSRDSGGDQGWVLSSSLPAPLRKAVRDAKPGLITTPVRALGAWYVLDVIASRPARAVPFAKVRARLGQELTRVKRAKALEAWLAKARKQASILQK